LFPASPGVVARIWDSTVRRQQSPIRFWLYFELDVLLAGLFVYLVAMGKVQ